MLKSALTDLAGPDAAEVSRAVLLKCHPPETRYRAVPHRGPACPWALPSWPPPKLIAARMLPFSNGVRLMLTRTPLLMTACVISKSFTSVRFYDLARFAKRRVTELRRRFVRRRGHRLAALP